MLSINSFVDKPEQPTDEELTVALGAARALWNRLLTELASEYGLTATDWHSYSRRAGWSLRVRHKDRNIFYLSPHEGTFVAALTLGDKAIAAARKGGLPKRTLTMIDDAKRYVEGTVVRLEVKRPSDIPVVKKLVAAKLAN